MKQRIITPLDGSARAEAILPHAAALARATGSDIVLLQIVAVEQAHALLTDMAAVHAPTRANLERALTLLAEQTLAQHAHMLRAMGIGASYEVAIGEEAATAILARGDPGTTLAIALATHGAGDACHLPHGTTASRIIHDARVPLLILPTAKPSRPMGAVSYRIALVLVDEVDFMTRDLQPLWRIARAIDGTIVLAVARQPHDSSTAPALDESLSDAAHRLCDAGATVHTRVLTGSAATLARSACAEERADLLLLPLHSDRERRWFSAIANDVLRRTGLPALLVPIPEQPRASDASRHQQQTLVSGSLARS